MLRVLFIVLSVVSIALAAILGEPLLYLVAAGLLVAAAIILTAGLRSKKVAEKKTVTPAKPSNPSDELKSLGIVEIRPKGAAPSKPSGSSASTPEEAEPSASGEADAARPESDQPQAGPSEPPPPARRSLTSESGAGPLFAGEAEGPADRVPGAVRKRARSPRIMVEGVVDALAADVVLPTLRALRAAIDANTVALLRQEGAALRYYVDAIVSRNAFARNGGRFVAAEPLVSGKRPLQPAVFSCTGADGFDAHRLGYYHDSIAVHEVAFVPLTAGGTHHYLLVADSMEDGRFDGEEPRRMLREFGRLLQALVLQPGESARRAMPSGEPLRPRREIIAEEMEQARADGRHLALALVYLNAAEAISRAGEEAVAEAEAAFRRALQDRAGAGRVERFGELTYGVFRSEGGDHAATWASELQLGMAREAVPLAGGISVGIAVLGDQHDGPDQLRADATSALRESYESGECIVLE